MAETTPTHSTTEPPPPGSAGAAHPQRTTEEHHVEPNYMAVFLALFVLTIGEVAVALTPIAKVKALYIPIMIAFALAKAALVAAYFMHLKFERTTLIFIVLSPLILSLILVIALLPDHLK